MKKCFAILATCAVFGVASAHAGNVDTMGIGAKATAMGGAFSAYADDPFAAYYNPAGLSQIEGKMVSAGASYTQPEIDVSNFKVTPGTGVAEDPAISSAPKSFSADSDALIAPHLGYAQKVTDRISFGLAAYAPWGLVIKWDKDPAKNPGAWNYYKSYYVREVATPTMSYKVNDKFSVGVGVSVGRSLAGANTLIYSKSNGEKGIDQLNAGLSAAGVPITLSKNPVTLQGQISSLPTPELQKQAASALAALTPAAAGGLHGQTLKVEMEDNFNISYNLGLMYKPTQTVTFGLTYRSETKAEFKGKAELGGVEAADVTLGYNHPQQVQAGVRYQPHEKFSFEVDYTWTNWSIGKNQSEPFVGNDTQAGNAIDTMLAKYNGVITSPRNWEDTRQVRLGAEYALNDLVTLRGGYFYDPSPIGDNTIDLQWPDTDKETYSIGAGFNFNAFTLDCFIQYTDIPKPIYAGGESPNLNKSYYLTDGSSRVGMKADGSIYSFGFTANYKF